MNRAVLLTLPKKRLARLNSLAERPQAGNIMIKLIVGNLFMKKIYFLILLIVFIFVFTINICAINTDFSTLKMEQKNIDLILKNTNIKEIKEKQLTDFTATIKSFDVSNDHNVLLGLSDNHILILDNDRNILNCLNFDYNASWRVCWKGENILLYLVRSNVFIELTQSGKFVSMSEYDTKNSNNATLMTKWAETKDICIDGYTYILKNTSTVQDLFSGMTYSQLIMTDNNGHSKIIYDVSKNSETQSYGIMFLIITFCLALALIFFIKIKQYKIETKHNFKSNL
ncbi:MAG: hypothetical protein IJX55_06800 [Clostridia bacterium]|nr:hypothetical protein [Clostridia bacterium]